MEPFPADGRHWQLSIGGGTSPLWARSGQELFYVARSGALMRMGVERSPTWVATVPAKLIGEGYVTLAGARSYDISPDGQRILMIKPSPGSDQATAPRGILVVQNWGEELMRLVPTK